MQRGKSVSARTATGQKIMNQRQVLFQRFKHRIKNAFTEVFDSPLGRPAKKAIITVVGVTITLLGVLLIILPGPASLLIPVGLAILALEYPIARKWLRKFQHLLSVSAKKADAFFSSKKAHR